MKLALFVSLFTVAVTTVRAAEPSRMTDTDLLAARKVCTEAQTAGGGTLAGQPELATLCTPIIAEHDKRLRAAAKAKESESTQKLRELLKK